MSEIEELKRQLAELRAQMAAGTRLDEAGALSQGTGSTALGAGAVQVRGNNGGIINLGILIQAGSQPGAPEDDLRRAYLARILAQANHLPLYVGDGANDKIRLSAVYTALLLDAHRGPAEVGKKSRPVSALDLLNASPRMVLLGGPGSGKSTFVNYVSLAMAGEFLGAAAPNNIATLTAPIPAEEGEKKAPQQWRHGALLPVRVILRDVTAFLPGEGIKPEANVIWHYLEDSLRKAVLSPFADMLHRELAAGRALVLFDGLDEVPGAHHRREQIKQAVEAFVESFSACRYLVTSRTYAYQKQEWRLADFPAVAPLKSFRLAQIHRFAECWYAQMVELLRLSRAVADERLELLKRAVEKNPRIRELAERPLLLTLIAQLQTDGGGSLPEKREELYDKAVDMLIHKWQSIKVIEHPDGRRETEPSLEEWLKSDRNALRRALNRLAFEAHRDQPRDPQNPNATADISQDKLVGAVLRASSRPDEVKVGLLEQYLRDRAGLLAAHGVDMYQFPHRSFQEYLAACHLTDDAFPDQVAALAKTDPDRWREVLLLAGAKAARGSASNAWLLAETLCPKEIGSSGELEDVWGALLAGRVLVEAADLTQVAERDRGKLERIRDWQLAILRGNVLPATERALAGRTLAVLGDPRPEVMTLDGMEFCYVPAGPFIMGDDGDSDASPQHVLNLEQPFFIGRYPISAAQWQEFRASSTGAAPTGFGRNNEPVTEISWFDALDFCTHLTRLWETRLPPGWAVTLPSEAQWEKAARGGEMLLTQPSIVHLADFSACLAASPAICNNPFMGRAYPWGETFDPEKANTEGVIEECSALGCYATGASPWGCEDMAGNIWEWTRSLWGNRLGIAEFGYPYRSQDGREVINANKGDFRVVRGGAWLYPKKFARCNFRNWDPPDVRTFDMGFRVVLSPV